MNSKILFFFLCEYQIDTDCMKILVVFMLGVMYLFLASSSGTYRTKNNLFFSLEEEEEEEEINGVGKTTQEYQ